MEAISSTESHRFQWKQVPVVKTIPFGGIRLSQTIARSGKPFLLVEDNHFSGSHCFYCKPFRLVEAIPFSGSHSFWWKPFRLVGAIPSSGSHSF